MKEFGVGEDVGEVLGGEIDAADRSYRGCDSAQTVPGHIDLEKRASCGFDDPVKDGGEGGKPV
ncbi:hypothetical protein ACFTZB_31155 [Rhodococcus sp. NPDC057014]|uniref:hypothetical protein n=1 Tax=Rhodococcus sp. NPDC057014 TaxID=3346000 RepID=UPI003643E077